MVRRRQKYQFATDKSKTKIQHSVFTNKRESGSQNLRWVLTWSLIKILKKNIAQPYFLPRYHWLYSDYLVFPALSRTLSLSHSHPQAQTASAAAAAEARDSIAEHERQRRAAEDALSAAQVCMRVWFFKSFMVEYSESSVIFAPHIHAIKRTQFRPSVTNMFYHVCQTPTLCK